MSLGRSVGTLLAGKSTNRRQRNGLLVGSCLRHHLGPARRGRLQYLIGAQSLLQRMTERKGANKSAHSVKSLVMHGQRAESFEMSDRHDCFAIAAMLRSAIARLVRVQSVRDCSADRFES